MQFAIQNQVCAKFKLITKKKDQSISSETEWFDNIVLDTGLNRMSVGTWIDRCCVGSGNSTPIASNTALDNIIASTTTKLSVATSSNTTTSPYYWAVKVTWRFGEGIAAGNLSEVGLGWGGSNLWNRALIRDTNGNPTTITILSDEYLDVISEIRCYSSSFSGAFNLLDKTGNLKSSHSYIGLPFMAKQASANFEKVEFTGDTNYLTDGLIGSPSSFLTGAETNISSNFSVTQYPTPTSARTIATLQLANANNIHKSFGLSVKGLMCPSAPSNNSWLGFKVQIDPPITKLNTQIMTYTFEISWGRYESP